MCRPLNICGICVVLGTHAYCEWIPKSLPLCCSSFSLLSTILPVLSLHTPPPLSLRCCKVFMFCTLSNTRLSQVHLEMASTTIGQVNGCTYRFKYVITRVYFSYDLQIYHPFWYFVYEWLTFMEIHMHSSYICILEARHRTHKYMYMYMTTMPRLNVN